MSEDGVTVEWMASKFRLARQKWRESKEKAQRLTARGLLSTRLNDLREEMEEKLRVQLIIEEVDKYNANEAAIAAKAAANEAATPWATVPPQNRRTMCIDVNPTKKGSYNDTVVEKLMKLHDRGRIAKLFADYHGTFAISKSHGDAYGMQVEYVAEPEPDPHRYTIVYVHGMDNMGGEDGWWTEIDDETGEDDYPAVWINDDVLNALNEHPMIAEHNRAHSRLPASKRAEAMQNCRQVAGQLGEEYTSFETKVNNYFMKLQEESANALQYEFKYECKYLYKHSVEL